MYPHRLKDLVIIVGGRDKHDIYFFYFIFTIQGYLKIITVVKSVMTRNGFGSAGRLQTQGRALSFNCRHLQTNDFKYERTY